MERSDELKGRVHGVSSLRAERVRSMGLVVKGRYSRTQRQSLLPLALTLFLTKPTNISPNATRFSRIRFGVRKAVCLVAIVGGVVGLNIEG